MRLFLPFCPFCAPRKRRKRGIFHENATFVRFFCAPKPQKNAESVLFVIKTRKIDLKNTKIVLGRLRRQKEHFSNHRTDCILVENAITSPES